MNHNRLSLPRRLTRVAITCAVVVVVLATCQTAMACPSCKAALANQEGRGDLVKGFFYSIMFMLSMPFAILGSFSGYMYMLVRRARRLQQPPENPLSKSPTDRHLSAERASQQPTSDH